MQFLLISKSKDMFHDFELCWFYVATLFFFKIIAKGCLFILHPFYSVGLNRSLES